MQEWTIVYEQEVTANDHDIWGMRLSRTGVPGTPFAIATGTGDDRDAEVSSLADVLPGEPWLVVWERFVPGGGLSIAHYDVCGRVFSGATALSASPNARRPVPTCRRGSRRCISTARATSR